MIGQRLEKCASPMHAATTDEAWHSQKDAAFGDVVTKLLRCDPGHATNDEVLNELC
jgi:hypothetical protein